MNGKTIAMGMAGAAVIGAAALLMAPKKSRRVKKALRTVGNAIDTISGMIG